MRKPKLHEETTYRDLPVNVNPDKGQFCYEHLLENCYEQLFAMLDHYSEVYVLRFDLHLPDEWVHTGLTENQLVSLFFKRIKELLQSPYGRSGPNKAYRGHCYVAYQWVAEVEKEKKFHYHCWIALSGHRIQNPGSFSPNPNGLLGMIIDLWKEVSGGGHAQLAGPKGDWHSGHRIGRKTPELVDECFYHLSYMAKERCKGYGGARKGQVNYGSSRLGVCSGEKVGNPFS